ncbi:MAG: hypothetical protein FWC55_04045 [Firmicutes bacterium]|nr:hypothetical protein [Bacillota bacterium]
MELAEPFAAYDLNPDGTQNRLTAARTPINLFHQHGKACYQHVSPLQSLIVSIVF